MNFPFSLSLALRYLRPKRTAVSAITVIAIFGVAISVCALVVVIAVMTGFERKIKETILGMEPHVAAFEVGYPPGYEFEPGEPPPARAFWEDVAIELEKSPEVESVSPMVNSLVFVEALGGSPTGTPLWGVDPYDEAKMAELGKLKLHDGELDLRGENAFVGSGLSNAIGQPIMVGDMITIYSPDNVRDLVKAVRELDDEGKAEDPEARKGLKDTILPVDLKVVGIFDSIQYGELVVVPLHIGQELFELKEDVHLLSVRLKDPYRALIDKQSILQRIPQTWAARTWIEKHKERFDMIRNERGMMYMVMFVVYLAAAFGTMAIMLTVAVQKRQEIGILRALGARISQILWIFLGQGMAIGVLGILLGYAGGATILALRNKVREWLAKMGVELFSERLYGVSEIPAEITGFDIAVIGGGAFLLCSLAGLLPAFLAARVDPAKALRDD